MYDASRLSPDHARQHFRRLWEMRALVWHLSRTNKKAAFYDSALGRLWLIIDPFLTAATFYVIRMVFIPPSRADAGRWIAHLILGVTVFLFVRKVLEGAARAVMTDKTMVLNSSAPLGVYPTVALVRGVFDFIPGFAVYLVVHAFTRQPWTLHMLWAPVIFVGIAAFAFGTGLLLAPWVVKFRDIGTFIPHATRIWMYVTPVMFGVSEIPEHIADYLSLNPLFPFFAAMESVFTGHAPKMTDLAIGAAWAVGALVLGTIHFLRKERSLAILI